MKRFNGVLFLLISVVSSGFGAEVNFYSLLGENDVYGDRHMCTLR